MVKSAVFVEPISGAASVVVPSPWDKPLSTAVVVEPISGGASVVVPSPWDEPLSIK